jgi:hypothetical protein
VQAVRFIDKYEVIDLEQEVAPGQYINLNQAHTGMEAETLSGPTSTIQNL